MVAWLWTACGVAGAGGDAVVQAPHGRSQAPPGFWEQWGDGKAEVDSYALSQPRYGEVRHGTAVWVFVTEDFTEAQRVKSDGGHGDEYPVLKHNDIRHFQTGVYDYDWMTSTFTRIDGSARIGAPVKVSFGMQEWCGHVYSEILTRPSAIEHVTHSYFDGESDPSERLSRPRDLVLLDQMPTLARGIAGLWPAPGAQTSVTLLDSLARQRLEHHRPELVSATVQRTSDTRTVTVPAGTFSIFEVSLQPTSGPSYRWEVEAAPPHRVVRWSTSDGEIGELVASVRIPYWQLHGEADERWLNELGLAPTPLPVAP